MWLVGVLAAALLPFVPMTVLTPAAQADEVATFDGKEIKALCTIENEGSQSCPAFPPPPGLINAGAMAAAGPEVAASLRKLESRAVDNTLADHQLPASDRDAVTSWGRSDAQAELWALVVEALNTPEAERTNVQQHAAEWMTTLASAQSNESAKQAGAEYATWAGLDVRDYGLIADTATQAELTAFLSSDVRARSPLNTPRGGYCRYQPPAPDSTEYDGSKTITCFGPCPVMQGCPIPTPTYDDFVSWGKAAATYPTVNDPKFQAQAATIAAGVTFGAAVVATGVAIVFSTAIATALFSTALAAAIWPWFAVAGTYWFGSIVLTAFVPTFLTAAELSAAFAASLAGVAVVAAVAVVIVAIVYAVLEGIRVTDNAKLPEKVAELVVGGRTTITDASTLIGTTEGAATLFSLFVGVTLPLPRNDLSCDNSLVPPWVYSSSLDPGLVTYVPLGQNKAIIFPRDRSGCLNAPPIPPASQTNPGFLVTKLTSTGEEVQFTSPTITMLAPDTGITQSVRMSGNWFVDQVTGPDRAPATWQSLWLSYTDWDGESQLVWPLQDAAGVQRFVGIKRDPDSASAIQSSTCDDDGTCWTAEEIRYLGPDNLRYRARIEPFEPATGTPSYLPTAPVEGSRVDFSANDFAPGGATGDLRYTWRFQNLGCGWLECLSAVERGPDGKPAPSYSVPVTGRKVSHTWQSMGPAKVELTAEDVAGHQAVTTFMVNVGNVAPWITLGKGCPTAVGQWDCDDRMGPVGSPVVVTGDFFDAGESDDENVVITWGDGHQDSVKAGPNSVNVVGGYQPTVQKVRPTAFSLSAEHSYTEPGIYYGTVSVSDWGGGTDLETFTATAIGPQEVTFPAVADHTYGDRVEMPATGSLSGVPVTYVAGPAQVCTATGETGATVEMVGVGQCTITASQAAHPPVFGAAPEVQRTFQVTRAPLSIRAKDRTRVYGAPGPELSTHIEGLVNGDTEEDLAGLELVGPPADSGVGQYPIVVSGGSNPNYEITRIDGVEEITPAPLTITAEDKTKVYGAPDPEFTASFDGLVNGDTEDDITGLWFATLPPGVPVGTFPILPRDATNPNYELRFRAGTLTVTTAPLTITAADRTVASGQTTSYPWSGSGWVNGDSDATLSHAPNQAPTCSATVQGSAASPSTPPGIYLGAIACQPAVAVNYTIGYASGALTINPVITLDQQGLPAAVAARAVLDLSTVTLPVTSREVGFGTAHSFRFRETVFGPDGKTYVTKQPGFTGPVTANISVTATYLTMAQVIQTAVEAGGIDSRTARTLLAQWKVVEDRIRAGPRAAPRKALKSFTAAVRTQSRKRIRQATVDNLIAYAQAVDRALGGTGNV